MSFLDRSVHFVASLVQEATDYLSLRLMEGVTKETASLGSLSPNPTAYGLLMRNLFQCRFQTERAAS